jgi:hypothetical protein
MLQDRVDQMAFELSSKAGLDSLSDRYIVGAMAAYKDLLGIDLGELDGD